MKATPLALALAVLVLPLLPDGAHACKKHRDHATISTGCCEAPAYWSDRHDPDDARLAITTRNRGATLLLTDEVVAVQLSDRAFHRVQRKLRAERGEDEDNVLARAIRTAVMSSVAAVLDHSAECEITDIRDVQYRQGQLVFVTEEGDRLFENMDVDDENVMAGFSERDARAFVQEFRRLKSRER